MLTVWQKEKVTTLIVALRSGGYEQGISYLRTPNNKFCCLGVACDLVDSGEWRKSVSGDYYFLDKSALLPESITQMYGFSSYYGVAAEDIMDMRKLATSPVYWNLTTLNDEGFTFSMIADIIEYWLENN